MFIYAIIQSYFEQPEMYFASRESAEAYVSQAKEFNEAYDEWLLLPEDEASEFFVVPSHFDFQDYPRTAMYIEKVQVHP